MTSFSLWFLTWLKTFKGPPVMFNVSNIFSRQMSKVRLCSGLVELFNSRSRLKCQSKVNLWYVSTLQRSLAIIFSIRWGLGTMLCSWCNKPTQRKWWLARMYLKKKLWNQNGNKVSNVIWQVFFSGTCMPTITCTTLACYTNYITLFPGLILLRK